MKYDVIVIGAGASGLVAMNDLTEKGYNVCMLEATENAGGRIATIKEGFTNLVEAGAEFIHGNLPLTTKLLTEAGIDYGEVKGKMIGVLDGSWQTEEHDEHWIKFMHELNKLKTDVTILQFLDAYFSGPEYIHLRQAVQGFAEGFNLADISKASILSVKTEWENIDKKQYRIKGGYIQLINYLIRSALQKKGTFYFNTCVNKIEYEKGNVVAYTTGTEKFEASGLIITVSLGVLQSGSIQFKPALTDHAIALQGLGFGAVIKFLFEFKTRFWNDFDDNIGFLLTNEEIPTWWTQLPSDSNLLTGWLGGPKAAEKIFEPETSLLQIALQSLSSIFHLSFTMLQKELIHHKIICWQNQQYIKGGYSYNTLGSNQAKKVLSTPIDDTIYFAGEAVGQGESVGTVESALQSGRDAAAMLIERVQTEKQSRILYSSSGSRKL
ncbi:MAG TPA: NAD(P)/FAD-dependent oxidoreductase [Chitinophagaceae bacterium]|nr:NAD(P)/FAD-dependent oxidoreductase [Chitinophagaceae bacterium]